MSASGIQIIPSHGDKCCVPSCYVKNVDYVAEVSVYEYSQLGYPIGTKSVHEHCCPDHIDIARNKVVELTTKPCSGVFGVYCDARIEKSSYKDRCDSCLKERRIAEIRHFQEMTM